jgi:hypothetical protein
MTTRANLYVDQGVDYLITLDLFTDDGNEFDVDTYTFHSSAKKIYSEKVAFTIDTRVINDDDDPNNFELYIGKEKTQNINPGKYTYDILMISDSGVTQKILEGIIFVLPTVTTIGN